MVLRKLSVLTAALACAAPATRAHDPGLSASRLSVSGGAILAEVSFANADAARITGLDRDGDGMLGAAELDAGQSALLEFARAGVVLSVDGAPAALADVSVGLGPQRDVEWRLRFTPAAGSHACYEVRALLGMPRGHRHYAAVSDAHGNVLAEALLHARQAELRADLSALPADSVAAQGLRFGALGVEHILIGYDHILFLLTLLLVARGSRSTLAIISAFTVAHSLTLALAVLDVVRLPSALVESAIALSVVYVAVENLMHKEPRHRWRIAFVFGLVHGFGFASVLRDLGVADASGIAVPLLAFNLGVEVGQIAIAAVALPVLHVLRGRSAFERRAAPALSCAVAAVGVWWLVERLPFAGGAA